MYAFTACVRFLRHRSPAGLRNILSMVKEGGEWKIDGMGFPKFDNSI